MEKTWTVDEIMAFGPCRDYTRERVASLWAGRKGLTLREIVSLPIPSTDYGWCVGEIGRTDADLTDANLTGANLFGAKLTYAKLTYAKLTGADLTDANLTYAKLTDADLTDANLTDADLFDANLFGARIDIKWRDYLATQRLACPLEAIRWVEATP